MKKLAVSAIVACFITTSWAKVWTTVHRYDEKTPLEVVDPNHPTVYRDIMAGTHLTIVVHSDEGCYWWGCLLFPREERGRALLTGRGPFSLLTGYPDSCLEAAGNEAGVFPHNTGYPDVRLEFYTTGDVPQPGIVLPTPGDWFIFDYYAIEAGPCRLELHDFLSYGNQGIRIELGTPDPFVSLDAPIQTHSFRHVPSRDFNADTVVNLQDFAVLASHWRSAFVPDPNNPCATPDLNADAVIDINDLALFADFWLERTDAKSVPDPNTD